MLTDSDQRNLFQEVAAEVVGHTAEVEWLPPGDEWIAHARLRGVGGLVGYVLTSTEWHEARFEEPQYLTFLIADSEDVEYLRKTWARLAKVVAAYVAGEYEVEQRRGLTGNRTFLNVRSDDGVWRIGKRGTRPPQFEN
ncbi:hypothetical protein DJ010_00830 [Nocardioides silvaticus]|uniref:Uncharacterized protein n=1 Tax=Nocardioides silvaticus TaxID=2201891 RepID=A0A316TPS0_9ACTN|nr:hypothetical protein [Nocardioides silvaticus]PWN04232.1 hypothetical protein DJ010_00830 [Nocardioides silvaticus]